MNLLPIPNRARTVRTEIESFDDASETHCYVVVLRDDQLDLIRTIVRDEIAQAKAER